MDYHREEALSYQSQIHQVSNNLNDRILWYDGSISLTPEKINDFLLSGKAISNKIFVTELTDELKRFNRLNSEKITVKESLDEINSEWNIPEKYKNLNIETYVYDKLLEEADRLKDGPPELISLRLNRVEQELQLYSKYNIIDILKTLIFIVDTFHDNKVVWGTGRGSSCSSYILYLIGLHDVDSVEYELDLTEFFR